MFYKKHSGGNGHIEWGYRGKQVGVTEHWMGVIVHFSGGNKEIRWG